MPQIKRILWIVGACALALVAVISLTREPAVAAQMAPVVQQGGATDTYVVRRGDTLYSIARRFGTTVAELVHLNNLSNPNLIFVGQELHIPRQGGTAPPPAEMTPTPTPTSTPDPAPDPSIPGPPWTAPEQAIELFSPVAQAPYHSPIELIGFSRTFEGSVVVRLRDESGEEIALRNVQGGSVDGFDFFHSYLRFFVNEQQNGTIEVFEISAQDGSEIHKVTVPVILLPGQRVVDLNQPTVGAEVCSPVIVSGYSNTFEANVVVTLSQRDGTVLVQENTVGGNFGFYRPFSQPLSLDVSEPTAVLVSAFESNGIGIGEIDHTRVPVVLQPAGGGSCP